MKTGIGAKWSNLLEKFLLKVFNWYSDYWNRLSQIWDTILWNWHGMWSA